MPTTSGMKGGGYYNAHSNEQRAALDALLPWIVDAVAGLPLRSDDRLPIGFWIEALQKGPTRSTR